MKAVHVEWNEPCPHCLQEVEREDMYICIECDQPVCPHCVKLEASESVCPHCKQLLEEGT